LVLPAGGALPRGGKASIQPDSTRKARPERCLEGGWHAAALCYSAGSLAVREGAQGGSARLSEE